MDKLLEYTFLKIISDSKLDADTKLNFVKLCIESGVNINCNESIALISAIENGNHQLVELLVSSGIDVCAKNNQALISICDYDDGDEQGINMLRLLVENGADCTDQNNRAICIASEFGWLEGVKFFVDNGADPYTQNNKPLYLACYNNELSVVNYLLDVGAELNNESISSAFNSVNKSELQKILLEHGADPNTIHLATNDYLLDKTIRHIDLIGCELLLEYGADIHLCRIMEKINDNSIKYMTYTTRNNLNQAQQIIDLFMCSGLDISFIINKY